MRAKVLSLALLAAIMALPVPASQGLVGTFSAPSPVAQIVPGHTNLGVLLQNPHLAGELSYERPTRFSGETYPKS